MIGKRRDWHKKLFALLKTVKSHKFACEAIPHVTMQPLIHSFSGVFDEPVDTEKLNVPDYFEIVKNPMCLQASSGWGGVWVGGETEWSNCICVHVCSY